MEDDSSAEDMQHYSVAVSQDRDGFFRLTCPSCGLDFKIQSSDADLQHILEAQIRRVERDMKGEESEDSSTSLTCPYCGYRDALNEMYTEEAQEYFQRVVHRELIVPMMNDFANKLAKSWERGNRGSSSLISFEADTSREILPPRPIHGPEPADMKIVEFLCCGERAKIRDRWYAVNTCPFCKTNVQLS
ncbi:hypothetical protein [Salinibacter ruber]|uniref:Uncharacterized Zn finger protein (UPF0148 family) n=2 Tax=Salinibacter ruber TaxID=146919 RepID=A0A9X2TH67_9BACT|nr:hypothetical protein [Salinibacter ruber]MCS3659905.1 uncharacterized Zn finger protein (UPF0148 family) [Salinibacter ruber]MCS3709946.1 uncharacterized Zn finger protein (UPF0148 family) [Salinibacter ruber]MCS4170228.1 uncharacterized Zn finger protein (UPF0148 family) [Salinibacter ruber]